MSVLNQSGEEQVECPLCMEPLEVDDLNFYPCTCGYQICRFCWHRIRTDENGLCPACRKAYSENPADFTPLSKEQVAQLKAEKRQRDQQRKAKLSESRKHLASVRVVQKNLVFVVGLPLRLADAEILKKHEYFGKFGKIHKVVINQSTTYAGSQGPSASAYVTYVKSEDALKAIQNVNNVPLDGRLIKSSLGTTKYCSHFMKNQTCPKPDCMYLHDFGDPEASFTKEQMHAGKHQEYEKKLHEGLLNKPTVITSESKPPVKNKENNTSVTTPSSTNCTKDNWPQLTEKLEKTEKKQDKLDKKGDKPIEQLKDKAQKKAKTKCTEIMKKVEKKCNSESCQSVNHNIISHTNVSSPDSSPNSSTTSNSSDVTSNISTTKLEEISQSTAKSKNMPDTTTTDIILPLLDDNSSFFSQNTFQKLQNEDDSLQLDDEHVLNHSHLLNDTTEDWASAFGFTKYGSHLEELAKQRNSIKNNLENTYMDSFVGIGTQNEHNYPKFNQSEVYQNGCDLKDSFFNMLDKNLVPPYYERSPYTAAPPPPQQQQKEINGLNGLNGTSDHLSKFFEYYKNGQKDYYGHNGLTQNGLITNGLNQNQSGLTQLQPQSSLSQMNMSQNAALNQSNIVPHNISQGNISTQNLLQNQLSQTNVSPMNMHQPNMSPNNSINLSQIDKQTIMVLRQIQLEHQLFNLNMKSNYGQQQQLVTNGLSHGGQYVNGDVINGQNYGPHNQIYHNNSINNKNSRNHAEAELDFDPFQETQKALAELIENEQNHKLHNSNRGNVGNSSQLNGIVHSQSSNHLPPPPPGFVQPNTHMNSFGSKILPYLNMGSSQQQQNQQIGLNGTTQTSWPSSYSQLQQHKAAGIGACNDWKVLDPAIVSSSRHFPLANMTPLQDQYNLQQRTHDYNNTSNNSFTNFSQQLQQQPNGFNFLNTQQNLNWLGNELNTQISSPPGFRGTAQATKQQEC